MKSSQLESVWGYVFIFPWILGMLFFTAGPIIASVFLSFCEWDLITPIKWVGLQNYIKLFMDDPRFWKSLYNTLFYTAMSVPLQLVAGITIAVLMNQQVRLIKVFRTIFYLPSVTAGVASSIIWMWLFNPDVGLINYFLAIFGIHGPLWLASEFWAKPVYVIMSLWGVGGGMLVYLAGLQGIPAALYEAASIDGANSFQKFIHVTLPMLSPIIFFNLVILVIQSFQIFTQAYVMSGGSGAPADSTLFYVVYLYQMGFRFHQMGYASALAWILFLITLGATLLLFRFSGWVHYEGNVKEK
ncbi:MAG: sugar ABC transporter permease [Candidatus Firestonebacteria bacterium]|nr:sugar ABC transporter permease [Candidatus Firestonebacteria bacterium]